MKLAYSSNAFVRTDLLSALGAISRLGFQGAEILCDKPHWFPGEVTDQDVEQVAELLHDLNLAVSNLNANTANGYFDPPPAENLFEPSLSNTDPETRLWRRRYTIDVIQLAEKLNAPCVSITSGRPQPGCPPERALGFFIDEMKHICEAAEKHDIRVGIEYEPGLILENAEEVITVIEAVDSPRLGVNLDIGHSFLCRESPAETINLLAGRIWNIHLEDIKGNKHFHLIPGEGDLPFAEYLDALRRVNYQGFLTLELYSYPEQAELAGRQGRDYLLGLIND